MNIIKTWATLILSGVGALAGHGVFASDIAREVRNAEYGPDNANGGYFELGLEVQVHSQMRQELDANDKEEYTGGAGLALGGAYRYNGFFVEAAHGTFDGLNLGYNLWSNDRWSVDFLASSLAGSIDTDGMYDIKATDTELQRNEKLIERDTFYSGTGVRVTGYLNDYILQYRLVTDTHDGNGVTSTMRLGRHWQVRNWNVHGIAGLVYTSADTNNYWWGVTPEDASERFPAYELDATLDAHIELGVARPLSENIVFRSSIRFATVPDDVADSPLIKNDHSAFVRTSIYYVF